jgi:HEAT repeat protein
MRIDIRRRLFAVVALAGWFGLAAAPSVQAQSAAFIQNAIGVLTDASNPAESRINAARDLSVLARDSDAATAALMGVLANDPTPAVRSAAAAAIGYAAFPSAAPIQALIQALSSDGSPEVRAAAANGLGVVGVDSDAALQALKTAAAGDADPQVRAIAKTVFERLSSS